MDITHLFAVLIGAVVGGSISIFVTASLLSQSFRREAHDVFKLGYRLGQSSGELDETTEELRKHIREATGAGRLTEARH